MIVHRTTILQSCLLGDQWMDIHIQYTAEAGFVRLFYFQKECIIFLSPLMLSSLIERIVEDLSYFV